MIHGFWLYFLNTAIPTLMVVTFIAMFMSWIYAASPHLYTGVVRSIILTILFLIAFTFGIPLLITINNG